MVAIRIGGREDNETILRLLRNLYLELGEEAESVCFLTTELIDSSLSRQTTALLAFQEDEAAGVATVTETSAIYAGGNYGVIDEMYVLPEFRSQKIGEALMGACVGLARERGWRRLDVTGPTEAGRWERTIRFYQSHGFVFTGNKLKREI